MCIIGHQIYWSSYKRYSFCTIFLEFVTKLMQFYFRYYKYDWNNNIYCHLWHCMGWAILGFCHQSLFLWNISISGPSLLQFCNIYCFVSEFWIFCFFLSINTNSHGNNFLSLTLQNKTEKPFSTIGSASLEYTRSLNPADFSSAVFAYAHFQKKT